MHRDCPNIIGLIRNGDWALTSLGEPRAWPSRLQHLTEVMLSSPLPSFVIGGVDRIFIYNELFAKLAAEKHPAAFGRPINEGAPNLWAALQPHYEAAMKGQPVELAKVEWRASPNARTIGLALTPACNGDSRVAWIYGQIIRSKTALEGLSPQPGGGPTEGLEETDRVPFNEERLHLALDVASLGIWDWDMQTGKIVWSDEHFRIEGYALGEAEPNYDARMDRIHPDDRDGTAAALTAARDSRCPFEHKFRLRQPGGTERWCAALGGFFYDSENTPIRMIGVMQDITEQRQLTDSQQVLIMELQHRTRNLFSLVHTLTRRTLASSGSLLDFHERFEGRLNALARVQDLLSRDDQGQRFTIDDLVRTELAAHGAVDAEDVSLEGPPGIWLPSTSLHTFALAIHELATNASKYGALKGEGHLLVRWTLQNDADGQQPMLQLDWIETGVTMPEPGAAPSLGGYGREMIERALPYQLNARTSYELGTDGVRCTIILPVLAPNRPAYA